MKTLKKMVMPALLACFIVMASATDASKEIERIQNSAQVLKDFSKMKESIPSALIQQAQGIIVIPHMINAGLGVGGKRGKGIAMVKMADGGWSNPVFVTITGGSIGAQIGVQAVDLVLVFKHRDVLAKMQTGDFTIGGDISAAAGPVGRSTSANTDYKLEAEVYSYSRSKGLFAGLSINGTSISVDKASDKNFYGENTTAHTVFNDGKSKSADVAELKSAIAAL